MGINRYYKTSQGATEAYVNDSTSTAISSLIDSAPSTLDTLNEIAAAINDDAAFTTTITTALGNKLDSSTASSTYAPLSSPTITSLKSINSFVTKSSTSNTLALSDFGNLIKISNASSNTLTVPTNASVAFTIGSEINLVQIGAGQTTVVGDTGVTVRSSNGLKFRAQYSSATLIKIDTDEWLLVGDVSA